jgi:opacity protein-like surface antigen
MNKLLVSCFIGAGLASAVPAAAWADNEIDVGRLTAVFKEAGWKGGGDLPYNHELMSAQGTFRGKGKVFSLAAPDGTPVALMYVGASYPQVNVYFRREPCITDARYYVRDLNDSKLENARCAVAGGPYAADSLLNGGMRYLSAAHKVVKLAAPEQAFFVHTYATARGGYLVDVEVLLAPGFLGLPDTKAVAEVPALLRPGLAAWSDKLAEATVKALTSFSGNLVVPPVEFSATAK